MIDLHCHLLPGIDDGPPDIAAALSLAEAQLRAGVRTVAATPHVTPRFRTDAARVDEGVAGLREALRRARSPLTVVCGAEIDAIVAFDLPDEELSRLTLGGAGWLLLETPLVGVVPLEEIVASLQARGFSIVLAHPERSPQLQRDPASVARMVRAGARTQVTAAALVGAFGRVVRKTAERLVDAGLAHVIASDAHGAVTRPPGMRAPLERAGLGHAVEVLCEEHPARLLDGGGIPAAVRVRRHASLSRRLRLRR